jgi:hypothetical protein
MTGLSVEGGVTAWRVHGIVLNATLGASAGEQLAAHRIEWQPRDDLRLGVTETARYQSSSWQPLYAVGVIPYVLVQRLLDQDEPDSAGTHRNNVMLAFDARWRFVPGAAVYGEFLVDDLHAETADNPDKLGMQLGLEGARAVAGGRLSGGLEYTRLWRYVYTSFFGREYSIQGEPLGFPTGPDSRRIRARAAWDPNADWQVFVRAAKTDKGENDMGEPFVPGSPKPDPSTFEGVVERALALEAGLRWWPASGVDLAVTAGHERIDDAGHVDGAERSGFRGAIAVRLVR